MCSVLHQGRGRASFGHRREATREAWSQGEGLKRKRSVTKFKLIIGICWKIWFLKSLRLYAYLHWFSISWEGFLNIRQLGNWAIGLGQLSQALLAKQEEDRQVRLQGNLEFCGALLQLQVREVRVHLLIYSNFTTVTADTKKTPKTLAIWTNRQKITGGISHLTPVLLETFHLFG